MDGVSGMKQLGMFLADNTTFDVALLEVIDRFNELRRSNSVCNIQTDYKDIDIVNRFGRFWIVLIYEYETKPDQAPETPPEPLPETEPVQKSQWIGIPDGIDPRDPDWREKLETWRRENTC